MHKPMIESVSYLFRALDPGARKVMISSIINVLSEHEFDAVAFRGISGALVAPIIAYEMGKTVLAVRKLTRKDNDHCHSHHKVEGDIAARRYVVIDDCISSGNTLREILAEIAKAAPLAECIGIVRYDRSIQELETIPELRGSGYTL